ncbi:HD domain-containing protein [Finegoldia magna]|uniref:HDIG domain protein n=1 Tax=Finegoldia magna ATCC 53516 TaxID=525282 RepID=D6SB07_FINMA|nr:HD domain-containing protein [Finegoldia magna]EFH92657.1 HDIG domain protein [Finegoldia magna ATCC 53516]MDU2220011.1 HD domain-containing protein [Finegoldia magna]
MKNTDIVLNHNLFNEKINKIEDDEKTRVFCKHDFSHLMDVARICYIINLEENLNIDKDLIYVTALLHDLGRADEVDTGINHSILSQEIAQEILKDLDFDDESKQRIISAIKYHRTNEENDDRFIEIFYKADKLSRMCFRCPARSICNWPEEKKNKTIIY